MKFGERPIGDLVVKCTTWNPRTNGQGVFNYIDLGSIDKDAKAITIVDRYPCCEAPSRARQLIEKDDVLVATVRPNLNGVAIVGAAHAGMTASTGYCVLRPIPEKLFPRYLFHWVKTSIFVERMVELATGANYPAVSDTHVRASTIPLPPLAEQKRIAGILDAADALRAKRREALAQLDTLLQSTFLDMFGDPVTNPRGWEVKRGNDLARRLTVGVVVKPASYYVQNGVPALRSLNVRAHQIQLDNLVFVSRTDNETNLKKSRVWKDDLLLVRSGQPGTAAIVPDELSGVNAIDLLILTPAQGVVHPVYLCHYLNSPGGRQLVLGGQRGQVQKHLNVGVLKSSPIPLPPISLQRRFAGIVESVDRQKARMRAHLAELDALFASLQSRAFNGEL